MAEAVKGAHRERRRATRRRILAAATELFVADGYTATTLEQIARRAGVAVQTVYFHFGNKRTVLKEAVDVAAVGDDEPVALLDRPRYRAMGDEPDPRQLVTRWVGNAREIFERVAPLMAVVRHAAGADPDMAAQWEVNQQQRATAFRLLAQQLADRDALRPGTSVDEAVDVLLALASFEVYLILLGRGWTPQRWEAWLATTLTAVLLSAADPGAEGLSGS
jgi:AcrR family transcriptional regulator